MDATIISLIVGTVNQKPLPAVDFLRRIVEEGAPQDVDALLKLAPEFEQALEDAQRVQAESARIVNQCLLLHPVPATRQLSGF